MTERVMQAVDERNQILHALVAHGGGAACALARPDWLPANDSKPTVETTPLSPSLHLCRRRVNACAHLKHGPPHSVRRATQTRTGERARDRENSATRIDVGDDLSCCDATPMAPMVPAARAAVRAARADVCRAVRRRPDRRRVQTIGGRDRSAQLCVWAHSTKPCTCIPVIRSYALYHSSR
jgi:hypothetical protein